MLTRGLLTLVMNLCRKPDRQGGLDLIALTIEDDEDALKFSSSHPDALGSGLSEKFADQSLLFLVLDPCKQFLAEPGDRLRLVERHLVVNLPAWKMAGLTTRLKDYLDLGFKVRLLWS